MKGVVLAGGEGTRLRPLTHSTQKQLLPIANKPVLEYVIEDLVSAGIDDIALVLGGSHPGKVEKHFADGSHGGADLTFIHQGEPLGLAHAVRCAREFVDDDPFVVYFGDTIVDADITGKLVDQFDPAVHSAAVPFQRVSDPSRFGIAEFDGEDLVRVHEKPLDPPSELAYVGVVAFTPAVFDHIDDLEPSARGELELTDAIDSLVRDADVYWDVFDGLWKDVGTPEDLIDANVHKLDQLDPAFAGTVADGVSRDGPIRLGDGSVLEPSVTVIGPVAIGDDVAVSDGATVGPYASIGDGCRIERTTIEDSVVLSGATVATDATIEDSIVGPGVTVTDAETTRLVAGADSFVRLHTH